MLATESGAIDQVVIHRVDRLSRNRSGFVYLLDFFTQLTVGSSFVDEALASGGGALDRPPVSMRSTFAELEHSVISSA